MAFFYQQNICLLLEVNFFTKGPFPCRNVFTTGKTKKHCGAAENCTPLVGFSSKSALVRDLSHLAIRLHEQQPRRGGFALVLIHMFWLSDLQVLN